MAGALDRYVAAWTAAAIAASAVVLALTGAPGSASGDIAPIALLAVVIAVADRIELSFRFERATATFSLAEIGVVAAILLLPPSEALLAAILGSTIGALSRRLDLRRTLFNVSQVGVGTAVAAGLVAWLPPLEPTVAGRSVVVALVGMIAYSSISTAAILGVFRRLGDISSRQIVVDQSAVTLGTAIGTTAVGILLAHLWLEAPGLLPFLVAPAAAIHVAARASLRSGALLERVRLDRDRLTRVVDGASDGILLLDHDGTVQIWNPALESLTGMPGHQAVGRRIDEVFTDDLRASDEPTRGRWVIDEAHDGEPHREIAAQLRHPDGTVRDVRESHALVFDERGRCTGDVVVVRDVSRLAELERLRSDFVARISHELRTPLTPIRGFASVLLRRGEALTDGQRREALERIAERADHLGTLVEDLLLVTRVDRGELQDLIDARPIDLRNLLVAVVDEVTERENRTVSLHVAPDTGAALADPERVGQIVHALLDNACRYSPADTPIELELDQVGDDVRIRVLDHGPGIPRDHQERIFERFHRLEDPLTMRTSGVGLGLFLARQLAEAMHGSLRFEGSTAPPRGASFTLTLPTATPVGTEEVDRRIPPPIDVRTAADRPIDVPRL